jgi:NitT/TauT family transport system substrate-binding protein
MKLGYWMGAAALLAACAMPAAAQEKATLLTSWKAQAEHGGYYQAFVKGYYKDCGVDLTIRQGGPGIDPAQLLTGKAVDFTLSSHIDAILHMNAAGFPARALTAAFQITPQILMAHADSNINSFEDMKGHPIMISQGSRSTYWPFFRKKYGWDETQLRSYTGQLAQWLSDKNIVQQGLLTNEPFLVKKEVGWAPKVFLLADAGYRTYSSILTTSQDFIDQKPKVVQCVVSATNKGWVDFMTGDPTPGLEAVKKDAPNNTDELMADTIRLMKERKLVMNEDTEKMGFGIMTVERWKAHYDMLRELNILKSDVDYTKVLALQFMKTGTN